MPIYEYECPSCSARFEELRKIAERDQLLRCTACGSNVVRVLSSPNLLLNANSRSSKTLGSSESVVADVQITNGTFKNSNIGISLPEGAKVTMKGSKFENVKTPVEFRKKK
ncbi:MAG: zinc ribbon domain-containing protein [Deltaproteobacteria bacterium]